MSDYKFIKPSFEADNILELDMTLSYRGRIFQYNIGHSVLILKLESGIQSESKPMFIGFEPTYYMELPAWWSGGNIKTASKTETIRLYYELGFLLGATKQDLPKFEDLHHIGLRLFLLETSVNNLEF